MKTFKTHDEIKSLYDAGKFDIFYQSDTVKYQVAHLGSTIYCKDTNSGNGMGMIQNFPVENFYAVEKPIPEAPEENAEPIVEE